MLLPNCVRLIPYTIGQKHKLRIDLGEKLELLGLRVWNYNKSEEDTYRGVKNVEIRLDEKKLGNFVFRKATGNSNFEFGQIIKFYHHEFISPIPRSIEGVVHKKALRQDYEPPLHPSGFIFSFY